MRKNLCRSDYRQPKALKNTKVYNAVSKFLFNNRPPLAQFSSEDDDEEEEEEEDDSFSVSMVTEEHVNLAP